MNPNKNYGAVRNSMNTKTNSYRNCETYYNTRAEHDAPHFMGICGKSSYFYIYIIIYIAFLTSGAAIFTVLELPEEAALRRSLDNSINNFLRAYPNVSDQALEKLINEVIRASSHGVTALRNGTAEPNWNFGQSLFFASTVVTTIGYGHATPLSDTGKLFCILFAVVGIPLTLVLLSALVERFLLPTIWLLEWLESHLNNFLRSLNIRILHLLLMVSILAVLFLIIPAAVFALIEPEWTYLDSFYYCFISLTTIGLGDFIPGDAPGQQNRSIYKIATTVYLFLGITFVMLTLAVFYDIPQLNVGLLLVEDNESSSKPSTSSKCDSKPPGVFKYKSKKVSERALLIHDNP